MYESLRSKLRTKIGPAIDAAPDRDRLYYYYALMPRLARNKQNPSLERAVIRLNGGHLADLSCAEELQLKVQLQSQVLRELALRNRCLDEESQSWVNPDNSANYLTHELEHVRGYPTNLRAKTEIHLLFASEEDEKLRIMAVTLLARPFPATYHQHAIAFSEPKVLAEGDINNARRFAGYTEDQEFIDLIEQRIKERQEL